MYYSGSGVSQDNEQAAHWFARAAEQGNIRAQYNLGLMYINGLGVAPDFIQGDKWLTIAAAGNYPEAGKARDLAERDMTREQITQARRLANEWKNNRGQ